MNLYEELFQISKLLLAEEDNERAPEILLRQMAERALFTYSFPGNVRELSHAVERVCLLAQRPEGA